MTLNSAVGLRWIPVGLVLLAAVVLSLQTSTSQAGGSAGWIKVQRPVQPDTAIASIFHNAEVWTGDQQVHQTSQAFHQHSRWSCTTTCVIQCTDEVLLLVDRLQQRRPLQFMDTGNWLLWELQLPFWHLLRRRQLCTILREPSSLQ